MQPRKKLKLMPLSGPDGFQKSSAQLKTKKVSVPKFTSAFDKSDTTAKLVSPLRAPHSSLDPGLRSAVSSHSGNTVSDGARSRGSLSGAGEPRTEVTSSRRDPITAYKDVPLSERSIFYQGPSERGKDLASVAPHAPLKKLQAPELASILLENHAATGKPTKRVMSPPRFQMNPDHTKHHLTLSTTGIALATDLNTDGGNAELASILLHDQHPEISQGDVDGNEARRGLNFSPRKKRYGQQGPQFVRNGLAARASQVLSQAHTSLVLWQKEMESQVPPDDSLFFSRLKPDIRMDVVKIVHTPTPPSPKSTHQNLPCFGIALCRIHLCPSSAGYSRADFPFSYGGSHTLVKVLFSFSLFTPSRHSVVRNASRFTGGAEVLAWKPWYEVKTITSSCSSNPRDGADTRPETDTTSDNHPIAPPPPIPMPASFPMPLTLSSSSEHGSQADLPIADTPLLCTRFLFLR